MLEDHAGAWPRSSLEDAWSDLPESWTSPEPSRADGGLQRRWLHDQLAELVAAGGSDLHLTTRYPPMVRLHGEVRPLRAGEPLNAAALRSALLGVLDQRQRERLEADGGCDLAYQAPDGSRFRFNVFLQSGAVAAAIRWIPPEAPPLEALDLPPVVRSLTRVARGLVLVTGPTGSGKSTTLASMVDEINRSRAVHLITIEDPIEFHHHPKRAVVNQRQVGDDARSFAVALRHALRQDPDVILVGEMRDLETISTALTAAETGHLVLASLHTPSAASSVSRIVDVFPAEQQDHVRVQLASSLQGVVAQQLLRRADGRGRVAAAEVLLATPAVRNQIREGKVHQLESLMQSGARSGMQTMEQAVSALVARGVVAPVPAGEARPFEEAW